MLKEEDRIFKNLYNEHGSSLQESLKINDWSVDMLDMMLSEERYLKFKDLKTKGSMGEMSSFWEIFGEQASWYSLAGIKRHSWTPFLLMPHYGWHSDETEDTVYSLTSTRM